MAPQGSAKSLQATGELDLSMSPQSDSYPFYEMEVLSSLCQLN